MNTKLPSDLKEAEQQMSISLIDHFNSLSENSVYVRLDLLFEGLRISPISYRLARYLDSINIKNILLFPDMGACALAKRDAQDLKNNIYTFKECIKGIESIDGSIIIAVGPQPYDINEFEELCNSVDNKIIMLNGRLEDPIVGIGSVGRETRKRFLSSWKTIYYLRPIQYGALMYNYPRDWLLFKKEIDGYTFCRSFTSKPDDETIVMSL